jgi:hypothetical protein
LIGSETDALKAVPDDFREIKEFSTETKKNAERVKKVGIALSEVLKAYLKGMDENSVSAL